MDARVALTFEVGEDSLGLVRRELADVASVEVLPGPGDPERPLSIATASALVSWHPDREMSPEDWRSASQVRLLQTVSAGVDHVSFDRLPGHVLVAGNSGAYAKPVAEHAVAMALALAKRLLPAHQELASGVFDQLKESRSLGGSTVVILGYGGIGREVARLIRPFGARVIGVNRSGAGDENADEMARIEQLGEALARAEFLFVSLPLTRTTKGLIAARELAIMPRRSILINVARGEILDEDALYAHLVAEPEFLAGLDTWWVEPFRHGSFELNHPFLSLPNVLGSPHNSASVEGATTFGMKCAAANVARFLRGETPAGLTGPEDRFR